MATSKEEQQVVEAPKSGRQVAKAPQGPMWLEYVVVLQFTGKFAASIPRTRDEIKNMLTFRMPGKEPENSVPIEDLTEQVVQEVGADEGEFLPGWATFKFDENGLYYEGRNVRGHMKDCALQISKFFPDIAYFRAKVANKVYVVTDVMPLSRKDPDGCEQFFIQVMTAQGPRSSIKYIDWVEKPILSFRLRVLNDGIIKESHLRAIFEYGSVHGMGQERSQGWGRYRLEELTLCK